VCALLALILLFAGALMQCMIQNATFLVLLSWKNAATSTQWLLVSMQIDWRLGVPGRILKQVANVMIVTTRSWVMMGTACACKSHRHQSK
jgi:hypothetical protein